MMVVPIARIVAVMVVIDKTMTIHDAQRICTQRSELIINKETLDLMF